MVGPNAQIFKATYSGVPVYEMISKGVAVMRRRSDSWLNATQILKVAGFDKPQRTRVLERDVQKAEHEKVQGGYGKYQGTWVPLERGVSLAKQFNVEHLIRPLVDFQPELSSPPLAPKHTTTILTKPRRKDLEDYSRASTPLGSADGSMSSSPPRLSSPSRTPSPIGPLHNLSDHESGGPQSSRASRSRKRKHAAAFEHENGLASIVRHTPLHWACVMGRTRVVKLFISAGADVFRTNKSGQTALMRSVMFNNNYDVRKFPELYEILHRSTLNIDHSNRTVFHHIVDVTMGRVKVHAARYYLETILGRLADFPQELADIINFQDEDGETALTLAARCRSKRLVKLLIDHGADPTIPNKDGKTCEDYILEDERFRSSPVMRSQNLSLREAAGLTESAYPRLHHSTAAQKAVGRCLTDVVALMDSLAHSFDNELAEKERDINQGHALLNNIQAEILESQKTIKTLQERASGLDEAQRTLTEAKGALLAKIEKEYLEGWNIWLRQEQEKKRDPPNISAIATSAQPGASAVNTLSMEDAQRLESTYAFDANRSQTEIHEECERLRTEIKGARGKLKKDMEEFVNYQAEAGTGGRMADYRKLISAGCGEIPVAEVDSVVGLLLEHLESEELAVKVPWDAGDAPSVSA
ncbi:uncharacterized protein EI90DRAFT_3280123 [Cantharellus anzutake]|uniref:uncharacterized protein n=1 Tax=Cantharellus anzutake TaxID=1750568 RepID=UPI001907E3A0|nr:uncharacterized protein EI90DRAFT_3280123 [Cantharellus anzutake]KAF8334984.1 hypothetical protein EI90DRAFT_3280123 [Cantharellus anzutake]